LPGFLFAGPENPYEEREMTFASRYLPRFALLTVLLLYVVVLAGSIVRATGSGMGCPDWPKCYGRLIPPTDVSQIDFSKLDIGKFRSAWKRAGHESIEVTEETLRRDFSARATWIEFGNRLVGMISGLAALATFICALCVRPRRIKLVTLLLGQLILFGTVAWLGKVVVDTNLAPWKITMHLGLAVVLISTAILARHWTAPGEPVPVSLSQRWHLIAAFVFLLAQFLIGTQVRETVDHLGADACCGGGRLEESLGIPMKWHRAGAICVLTLVALAFFRLKLSGGAEAAAPWLITFMGLIVCVEYGAGVLLIHLEMPALLQPVHLFLATVLHGILLTLLLRSRLHTQPPASNLALA
jgi:cytochrome c oxidase assembly protein subunit 15